jgi:hypothetical protein
MEFQGEELNAIYALGRLYYELGYLSASERILAGLTEIDDGFTPARVALGVIKLESGKAEEAIQVFRSSAKSPRRADDIFSGKLGLVAAFLFLGDIERATSLLREVQADVAKGTNHNPGLRRLFEAFAVRCGVD